MEEAANLIDNKGLEGDTMQIATALCARDRELAAAIRALIQT